MELDIQEVMASSRGQVDAWLADFGKDLERCGKLGEACAYSLLAPAKRLRPSLVLLSGAALGVDPVLLRSSSLAIECIHTASLIHDDLPIVDNDNLRRGKPTCHVVYGGGVALFAGLELISRGLELVCCDSNLPETLRISLIGMLCDVLKAIDSGQCLDLGSRASQDDDRIEKCHGFSVPSYQNHCYRQKTGLAIGVSIALAVAVADGYRSERVNKLVSIGTSIGVAFQIADDLLSYFSSESLSGKNLGLERDQERLTMVDRLGAESALAYANELLREGKDGLREIFGPKARELCLVVDALVPRRQ